MNLSNDVLIAGAGLAGSSAALALSAHFGTTVLEATAPSAGATGAAAGMVNPLMGIRARPCWRMEMALAAFHELLETSSAAHLYRADGILRPARDPQQAERFLTAAAHTQAHADWWTEEEVRARFPLVNASHGALHVVTGGSLDLEALVAATLSTAQAYGAQLTVGAAVRDWHEHDSHVDVEIAVEQDSVRARCRYLVLALGADYHRHPQLAALNLHRVKGQTIDVENPFAADALPHLSGTGYVVPTGNRLILGSTYEHEFEHTGPTDAATDEILGKAALMLPGIRDAALLAARAGVRVTVPGTRLPMLGPLPAHRRTWIFSGLGAKGLLTAPMLARWLPAYLTGDDTPPPEVAVR